MGHLLRPAFVPWHGGEWDKQTCEIACAGSRLCRGVRLAWWCIVARSPHVETRSQGWAGAVWYCARLLLRSVRPIPIVDGFPVGKLSSWQKRPAHANQQPVACHQSFLALGSENTRREKIESMRWRGYV